MKKVLAFVLALSMCLVFATGCTKIASDDPAAKGAEFDVYFGKKVMNLDPAIAYTDEEAVKILNLIYEGLFKLDEKGRLKKALAKKYEILEDPKTGEEYLEITLKDTYWSDSSRVQAEDVVYAWRRILDPNFDSPAASMLYCIKGAKDAKFGLNEASIYTIGLYAVKSNQLRVYFEEDTDIQEFLYNLASPALVPLRENKVATYPNWSKSATDLSTNGPFRVKKFSDKVEEPIILERSKYYYLNQEVETEAVDKYVTPYRITIRSEVPQADLVSMYDNKELFYASGLTPSTMVAFEDAGYTFQTTDAASAFMFFFNFDSKVCKDPVVRRALAIALDRDAIADEVGLEAATGILNDKVYNTKKGTSFREVGGDILTLTEGAGVDAAKAYLANNGVDAKKVAITVIVRKDEINDGRDFYSNDRRIAKIARDTWSDLGFAVDYEYLSDADFQNRLAQGSYDIAAMDYQMISAYALYNLAMFSSAYSADASLLNSYTNADFDQLLDSAFKESDANKRAEILHDAEQLLIEDSAVIPVVFNSNTYVVSKELTKVKTDYWGVQIFTKANLKNYVQYLPSVRGAASKDEE